MRPPRLSRRLISPDLLDDEQTRLAGLLIPMLFVTVSVMLMDAVLILWLEPEFIPTLWLNGVGILLCCVLLLSMRRGRIYLVGGTLCLSIWFMMVYNVAITGGMASPALGFLSLMVVAGFILYGAPGALGFGLLNIVVVVGLYLATGSGLLRSDLDQPTLARLLGNYCSLFIGLTLILAVGGRSFHHALRRVHTSEHVLADRNQDLQREIAERKRVEEALRESEEKFRTIFDTAPYGIAITRLDGTFVAVNLAGIQQVGMALGDIIGHTPIEIGWLRDIDRFMELTQHMKASGRLDMEEVTVFGHDGQPADMLFSGCYINLAGEQHVLISAIDIRDRKRAEKQAVEFALEREKARMLKDFIGDISHDLMTPLTVIRSSIYISGKLIGRFLDKMATVESVTTDDAVRAALKAFAQDGEAIRNKYARVDESTVRVQNLIRRMIEMVEVDGQASYEYALCDLNDLAARVIETQKEAAAAKALQLSFSPGPALPLLMLDSIEFERVLENLLDNALTYTSKGGAVAVKTITITPNVVLEVQDTGIGIPEGALPHIFERFYRVDTARRSASGGSGLGLTIARKIVTAHGGRIQVESVPGAGSSFKVILPVPGFALDVERNGRSQPHARDSASGSQ